jgi:peroxiredoxin Q/BCP
MLTTGDLPGEFTLQDQDGREVAWSSFRGRPVVVFFYPKADTPGCTKEACAFRDLRTAFEALGVAVVGVSADTSKRQASFDRKHRLGLPLLADPEHAILEPWGVWAEKKNYGKVYMGIVRSTFLFDADGRVVRAWPSVKVDGHVDQVLEAARSFVGR